MELITSEAQQPLQVAPGAALIQGDPGTWDGSRTHWICCIADSSMFLQTQLLAVKDNRLAFSRFPQHTSRDTKEVHLVDELVMENELAKIMNTPKKCR